MILRCDNCGGPHAEGDAKCSWCRVVFSPPRITVNLNVGAAPETDIDAFTRKLLLAPSPVRLFFM